MTKVFLFLGYMLYKSNYYDAKSKCEKYYLRNVVVVNVRFRHLTQERASNALKVCSIVVWSINNRSTVSDVNKQKLGY